MIARSPRTRLGARSAADQRHQGSGVARRAWRRRLAWALVGYGATGLVLALASLLVVVRLVAGLDSLGERQADVVRWLDTTSQDLADVQTGLTDASGSLAAAARSAQGAADLSHELAGAMGALRQASGVSILGSQPLAGLTDDFDRVASRADALATDMTGLSGAIGADTADLARVAADAGTLRDQVVTLRAAVAAADATGLTGGLGPLVAWALLGALWWAAPAVVSLAIGRAWLARYPATPRSRDEAVARRAGVVPSPTRADADPAGRAPDAREARP